MRKNSPAIIAILLILTVGLLTFGCDRADTVRLDDNSEFDDGGAAGENNENENETAEEEPKAPEMQIDLEKKYFANFETNLGNFKIELLADKAPKTVNNFVVLAKNKFYDGLLFHRVIDDFMIQGGDPNGNGTGGPGYQFEDEENDVRLVRGVVAMANSGPDTNGSQFFIITKENTDWLQGKHTAFGKVIEGQDTVMSIQKVDKDANDRPREEVRMITVTIEVL